MKISDIKELFNRSLDPSSSTEDIPVRLEEQGAEFDFNPDFNTRLAGKIFGPGRSVTMEIERVQAFYYVFKRIALTGVAAILILLLSIFLSQGFISLDSFLGLNDTAEESMVYLLTGI